MVFYNSHVLFLVLITFSTFMLIPIGHFNLLTFMTEWHVLHFRAHESVIKQFSFPLSDSSL